MKRKRIVLLWLAALVLLGACAEVVGIEDPKPLSERPDQGSGANGTTSSGGTSGEVPGPWVGWPMPNPSSAGLPNPSSYTVDATKDVVFDNVTKLTWLRSVDSGVYTQDGAKTYCNDLEHAGYTDWRLPWRIELISLIDYTRANPAIDVDFPNTPSNGFWSASADAEGSSLGWIVMFDDGDVAEDDASATYYVRCVR